MKPFIHDNFLIDSATAEKLYHDYAANQPIIDFHCHLSPALIAEDRHFSNLTQAWLEGDHYKWRAMRSNGITEKYCTGNGSDIDKFRKWAETVPYTVGNPLYHWTHLELARYFGIYDLLSPATADAIYEKASSMLRSREYTIRAMLCRMKAEIICTTDDPCDSLEHHRTIASSISIMVFPTFRPDAVLKTGDPEKFKKYIHRLAQTSGTTIRSFYNMVEALHRRHSFFHDHGCRVSDHGLDRFYFAECTPSEVNAIFKKLMKGNTLSAEENEKYCFAVMTELCKLNHERGWTQQFHAGAMRNNNSRKFRQMGPDTGWDSIGVTQDAYKMSRFLDSLDNTDQLARTILYNLNPADNEMMITLAGSFNDGSYPAKVQYGAAWWFLDQMHGMEKHLKDLSSFGLLRRFVGMVTDSRSFLSYPRHEYFRRLLCSYIGGQVEKGLIPDDPELLKPLIEGIAYKNAKNFFNFKINSHK
jgi:glucuronate isomerase